MTVKINTWTLEIEGIEAQINESHQQSVSTWMSRKIFIGIFASTSLYNLIFLFVSVGVSGDDFMKKLIFTLIADLSSMLFLLIFVYILPYKRITFNGMNIIPMTIMAVFQVEFNAQLYEYETIAC